MSALSTPSRTAKAAWRSALVMNVAVRMAMREIASLDTGGLPSSRPTLNVFRWSQLSNALSIGGLILIMYVTVELSADCSEISRAQSANLYSPGKNSRLLGSSSHSGECCNLGHRGLCFAGWCVRFDLVLAVYNLAACSFLAATHCTARPCRAVYYSNRVS